MRFKGVLAAPMGFQPAFHGGDARNGPYAVEQVLLFMRKDGPAQFNAPTPRDDRNGLRMRDDAPKTGSHARGQYLVVKCFAASAPKLTYQGQQTGKAVAEITSGRVDCIARSRGDASYFVARDRASSSPLSWVGKYVVTAPNAAAPSPFLQRLPIDSVFTLHSLISLESGERTNLWQARRRLPGCLVHQIDGLPRGRSQVAFRSARQHGPPGSAR